MFSSKQTWQNESVSFSVPSLQTLQTLSSSKSMLTNCSSFIVPLGGGDKGRDRYFNRHPGEAPAAPRLGRRPAAPHHAAAAPPPPGPRPRPAPTRQAESGTREGASQESFFLRARGGGGAGSGQVAQRPSPPAAFPPAHPSFRPEAGPSRPAPRQAPSTGAASPTRLPPPRTGGTDGPPPLEPPRPRSPPRRSPPPPAPAPRSTIVRPPAPPPPELGARHRPPLPAETNAPAGGGGRGGWALGPRSAAPERLTSPQSRAMKGGEAEGASGCRLPAPPRGHSHRELPCSPAVLGSPRARLQCLPRAGERGRGGG